ncbi:MAG: aminotransferase class V-fold PLP-dependent enzyme [Daejeonella sp.]|uniref:aminotransferase class V-fold PLP-dependent enzyme n=1 Tax=Daejeonella sp. TaxID=2805397 RepID=UPI0027371CDA|nr:aminotransferase class V-fold PLP-dependent enzyme [Daejeonella sp.]MDP3468080.1 aminotransferase class V-fold PLP-dependent enzyme [Daejeonella sp.]
MKRRNVIKGLALFPLAAGTITRESVLAASPGSGLRQSFTVPLTKAESITTESSFMAETNIFRSIGVEPIINCRGAYTIIGGSLELPPVREAMEAASQNFVQYDELAEGIGQRLADLTKSEWGMVSSGCAAGMKHVTAACVTGGSPEKLIRIPNLTGFEKNEVIIPLYSRNTYDHSIRNIGVTIIHVSTPEELERAINPRTAMIYVNAVNGSFTGQAFSLEVIAGIAKPKKVPVLIDAAAENLTIPSVHLERGADVVAYSGGKAMRGPQCAGLLLGNKEILMSAWQASSPHHGPGRDNKVGREEMIGMMAAVETWIRRDHEAEYKSWLSRLDVIAKKALTVQGVKTNVTNPTELSNKHPTLWISWDPAKLHVSAYEVAEEISSTKPRVAIGSRDESNGDTTIDIVSSHMKEGEDVIVANRIYEILSRKRSPRTEAMTAPASNLTGKWDVDVRYFNSTVKHNFTLQQDGNWINGTHKGDFDLRDINGTIEGNQIKLSSVLRLPGDQITFYFSGTLNGNSITGDIHMGEYRTATFTASKSTDKPARKKVLVPKGPPLAT